MISLRAYYLLLFLASTFATGCKTREKASVAVPVTSKEEPARQGKLSEKQRLEFETLFFEAAREKIQGNQDLAEAYFLKCLKIDPNSATVMYELASIYAFQNNKNQALYFSRKAAALDPGNIWFQLLYAECLKENKQPLQVAQVFEKLVKQHPTRIDFYYELANAYLYSNKASDAIRVYNRIEERMGVSEETSMQKVKVYKATGDFNKAEEETLKLIRAFPKVGRYYGILGEIYQEKGEPEKALQAYNDLLRLDPQNAYVHLSLADYYRNQKQNDKAFQEIRIAFQSSELDIDTKIKILLSYYSVTESYPELKPDAEELCRILIKVHPMEAKAFSMYGDFLYRDKKLEEARIQFRRAIELDKEKYALWHQLLLIESELNDYAAMEKESLEAIEYFPSQSVPYFFHGAASIQLKKYRQAVNSLEEGKVYVLDNPALLAQFHSTLGDAYNQLGEHGKSDASYEEALKIDPQNTYVLNNYAYYLSLRGKDLEKAASMSKRTIDLEPQNVNYLDTYGWILYQMKQYAEAKTWIGKALELGGRTNGTLLEHYGDVLWQLGEREQALQYWIDAQKAGQASDLIGKKIADKKLYE